jgi:hypothetical protein
LIDRFGYRVRETVLSAGISEPFVEESGLEPGRKAGGIVIGGREMV